MCKAALYFSHNAFEIAHDVFIGESQSSIAVLREPLVPAIVMSLAHVVRISIKLNDQLCFAAKKVSEIRTHGHLPAELPAADISARQAAP